MDDSIMRLYPLPTEELPLEGAYLDHDLRGNAGTLGKPFVFNNYITSLDGRIAIPHPTRPGMTVPDQTANDRDWRLFQELAVQSDVLITSGRYLRDYADGRAQEILNVYDDPKYADLAVWREKRGLPLYPALAVISNSLDFSVPDVLIEGDRSVIVYTSRRADPERIEALKAQTGQVVVAGEERVQAGRLVSDLYGRGHQVIYNTTGPKVHHLLLSGGMLDRLYQTFAHRLLGGSPFSSVVEGDLLEPPADFRLNTLYFDPHGLDGLGQLFAVYDRVG